MALVPVEMRANEYGLVVMAPREDLTTAIPTSPIPSSHPSCFYRIDCPGWRIGRVSIRDAGEKGIRET